MLLTAEGKMQFAPIKRACLLTLRFIPRLNKGL
jgi:hypothetical protein